MKKTWIFLVILLFGIGIIFITSQKYKEKEENNISGTTETPWISYELEKVTDVYDRKNPSLFFDRRLVGIQADGKREIILESIKEVLGGDFPNGNYMEPQKLSFPPYSPKIFFIKGLAETGHSNGIVMYDVLTKELKELHNTAEYENYYNVNSALSPSGFRIAVMTLDEKSDIWVVYLLEDKEEKLVTAENEIISASGDNNPIKWLDENTIEYAIYKNGQKEIRIISISKK